MLPGLHWGVKASFLDYLTALPDGRASARDGASATDDIVMVFEPAPHTAPPDGVASENFLAFRGDVRFAGHGGMLFVRIADPWIVLDGDQAVMTVPDPYEPESMPRRPLVQFTVRAGTSSHLLVADDVRLAAEATDMFNHVYVAGELMDPVTVFLPPA